MVDISRKNPALTGTRLTNDAMGAGGGGVGFGTGSKVISSTAAPTRSGFAARQIAKGPTRAERVRADQVEQTRKRISNEVLSDYEKARNRYDPEKSARDAGFASRADWAKALKGETDAEKSKFYSKKRGDH
jgi:hypothetical protein